MRNKQNLYYMAAIAAILLMLVGSKAAMVWMRGSAAAGAGSFWNRLAGMKSLKEAPYFEELETLKVQNFLLESELYRLKEVYEAVSQRTYDWQVDSIPARIIYRSPASWDSFAWINIGSDQEPLVKNSVVTSGTAVVGVIEQVNRRQSSIRLITDSRLTPSVRVKRQVGEETFYLAKGFLKGSSKVQWRRRAKHLQGFGFNYDFDDEYGSSRDLRSADPAIIQVDDILVTTGMDGVFPPDLEVAKVTKIHMLKEGDFSYEIEAEPVVGNLDELSLVHVLPPVQD